MDGSPGQGCDEEDEEEQGAPGGWRPAAWLPTLSSSADRQTHILNRQM